MKKLLAIMLTALMLLSFAACGKDRDKDEAFNKLDFLSAATGKDDDHVSSSSLDEYLNDNDFEFPSAAIEEDYDYYSSYDLDEYLDDNDFEIPSTSNSSKVEEYIEANKDELLSSMEQSFANSSGMTCRSSIDVIGNGFVIDIYINELDNVDYNTKAQMQAAYDSLDSQFETMLTALQIEAPEVEYFKIRVCEKDGDLLAQINAGD